MMSDLAPTHAAHETIWRVPGAVFSLDSDHNLTVFGYNQPLTRNKPSARLDCNGATGEALRPFFETPNTVRNNYLMLTSVLFLKYLDPIGYASWHPTKRDRAKVIQAEMQLWVAVFEALKEINCRRAWGFPYPIVHPGKALAELAVEGLLIAMLPLGCDDFASADAGIRHAQSITKQLRNEENPFPEDTFTHAFVSSCLALAGEGQGSTTYFCDHKWTPILKRRSDFTAAWKNSMPLKYSLKSGAPVRARSRKKTT
jgi:hypothetical protein